LLARPGFYACLVSPDDPDTRAEVLLRASLPMNLRTEGRRMAIRSAAQAEPEQIEEPDAAF
jgi:hypothetical protein